MTELHFKVWNIFGLWQSKLNKITNKTDGFLNNVFETTDFVVLTETWGERGDPQLFDWDSEFDEVVRISIIEE